MLNNP